MITERDKLIYREVFGDDGVYQDMLTWTVNTPLELYKSGGYKSYSGNYLKVIFDKVKDEITGASSYKYERFNFTGKDGVRYAGEFDDSEQPKYYKMSEIGVDHLKEFIDFYTNDLVVTYIQEDLEDLEDVYRHNLYRYLLSASRFMGREFMSIKGAKDKYDMDWEGYLRNTEQGSVDKYFENTGKYEDMYTNKWYRELQDRVMETIRDNHEREYERTRPGFKSLWGD